MPPTLRRETDIDLGRVLWTNLDVRGQPQNLRRELTAPERRLLELRRDELAPWVGGYLRVAEVDGVTAAIGRMFGGFPSFAARHDEMSAVARIDSLARLLDDHPLWAIEAACLSIRRSGYVVEGKTERHWAPADPEIVAKVRSEADAYRRPHASAVALLGAGVDARETRR